MSKSNTGQPIDKETPQTFSQQKSNRNTHSEGKNIHPEDKLLYGFCFFLMTFLMVYFWVAKNETKQDYKSEHDKAIEKSLILKEVAGEDAAKIQFLKAQLQIVNKRYAMADRLAITRSYIKYIGFMIGALMNILGTIVIVRRIRTDITFGAETLEKARIKLITSSPGIFLVLAGTIIIMTTILAGSNLAEVTDNDIKYPTSGNEIYIDTDTTQNKALEISKESTKNK